MNDTARLIDQRIRSQIMGQLESLAEGDAYVREWGFGDYVNMFFDWMPFDDGEPIENDAMTTEEHEAAEHVRSLMVRLAAETPKDMTPEAFIATGWPSTVATHAAAALAVFHVRGHLSQDVEEDR